MSLNQSFFILFFFFFLISQNIHADLKGPKLNINCTTVDVRGDVLWPPQCTIPAAVKANKNIHKKEHGSYYVVSVNKASSSVTL